MDDTRVATAAASYTKKQIYAGWAANGTLLITFYSLAALTVIIYVVATYLFQRQNKQALRAQLAMFRSSTLVNTDFGGSPQNDETIRSRNSNRLVIPSPNQ